MADQQRYQELKAYIDRDQGLFLTIEDLNEVKGLHKRFAPDDSTTSGSIDMCIKAHEAAEKRKKDAEEQKTTKKDNKKKKAKHVKVDKTKLDSIPE